MHLDEVHVPETITARRQGAGVGPFSPPGGRRVAGGKVWWWLPGGNVVSGPVSLEWITPQNAKGSLVLWRHQVSARGNCSIFLVCLFLCKVWIYTLTPPVFYFSTTPSVEQVRPLEWVRKRLQTSLTFDSMYFMHSFLFWCCWFMFLPLPVFGH